MFRLTEYYYLPKSRTLVVCFGEMERPIHDDTVSRELNFEDRHIQFISVYIADYGQYVLSHRYGENMTNIIIQSINRLLLRGVKLLAVQGMLTYNIRFYYGTGLHYDRDSSCIYSNQDFDKEQAITLDSFRTGLDSRECVVNMYCYKYN